MNMLYKLTNIFLDFKDYFNYDVLGRPVPPIPDIETMGTVNIHKNEGLLWVQSPKYPGLVASGENLEELREATFDALLTYFDVPRYRAKRIPDTLVLKLKDGTKIYPPEKIKLFQTYAAA